MKKAIPLLLILGIILLIPAYSGAKFTVDANPDNIDGEAHYEYRDYGNYGTLNYLGGAQATSGAYFFFDCFVWEGDLLDDIEDVMDVEARHLDTGRVYLLQRNDYVWPMPTGPEQRHGWHLLLKPKDWMYEKEWNIILKYRGSDGKKRWQVKKEVLAPAAFPLGVSNVTVTEADGSFTVSWSGIGNPGGTPINYRVRVLEAGEEEYIEDYRGDWEGGGTGVAGTYDPELNKVTFVIPGNYAGEEYGIRLENRLYQSRALYYLVLP